jgi:hypothetical protein
MIDLSTIKPARVILPPRIVLYGPEKIGKTTFCSDIEGAIFLDVEGGSGALNVARIEKERLNTFADVIGAVEALYTQQHSFSTVVIDTADWLEALVFGQVAREHGKKTVDEIGYGAGYSAAINVWKQLLDGLTALRNEKGMAVVLLAHDQVKRYDNPLTESYDRHQLKMHAKSAAIITEWADCLLFANQDVYIDSKDAGFKKKVTKGRAGDRVLHTVGSPSFMAGNRYGLPAELPFSWGAFNEAMMAVLSEPNVEPDSQAAA